MLLAFLLLPVIQQNKDNKMRIKNCMHFTVIVFNCFLHSSQLHYPNLSFFVLKQNNRTYSVMATRWVDDELKRIAAEMLADAGSILVVEIQTLIVLPAGCRTVQK